MRCKPAMRRAVAVGLTFIAANALAREPPRISADDRWVEAINAADKELAACKKLGVEARLYGDVTVTYERKRHRWTRSSSRSLDAVGLKAAACVQDAIAHHFHDDASAESFDDTLSDTQTIGTPVVMLPALARLLPVWRRARTDAKARGDLAKLLPPDYRVSADGCFRTDRDSIANVEYLWLPTVGPWIPRLWDKTLAAVLGDRVELAMWHAPGELVTKSARGLCLVPFDRAKQVAVRAQMDKVGTCWVGGFEDVLLHPHVAVPAGSYAQVATQNGRVCALSTAGEITCCGPTDPALPPPPKGPFTQLAIGGAFGCALDAKGSPTCWGAIAPPPAGPFTKLSAEYSHACGVRPSGELQCWGGGNYGVASPPAGTFADVAAASFSTCGVHTDHSMECWGEPSRATHPPGAFTRVAATWTHACGVRTDGTIGCWSADGGSVDTPLTGAFDEVAVADVYRVCGRAKDGTIVCARSPSDTKLTPSPAGTFTQIAGDRSMMCAVGTDRHVECWGELWPGTWSGDNTWPYAKALGLTVAAPPRPAFDAPIALAGRIVDEHGAPIAGADVLACARLGPCTTLGYKLMTARDSLAHLAAAAKLDTTATALRTTGADGRWSATVQRPKDARWGDSIELLVTAPGREIVERSAGDPAQLAEDVTLRPASSLDVDLRCGPAACTGKTRVALGQYKWYDGTHLERLPPGAHSVEATADFGQVGERRGTATVTVTFAGGAEHVKIDAKPVGTGMSIRGRVEIFGHGREPVSVSVRCKGAGGMPVYRATKSDATGAYELRDVGPPPCTVMASSHRAIGEVEVPALPADHVDLTVRDADDFQP